MYYNGIDLHKKTSYITAVNSMGKVVKKANLMNDENAIVTYFMELAGETKIVIESMFS